MKHFYAIAMNDYACHVAVGSEAFAQKELERLKQLDLIRAKANGLSEAEFRLRHHWHMSRVDHTEEPKS